MIEVRNHFHCEIKRSHCQNVVRGAQNALHQLPNIHAISLEWIVVLKSTEISPQILLVEMFQGYLEVGHLIFISTR